jgi:hypoxanthine-DNA glycosylase
MADRLTHEFGPFFDAGSEILILGSFPSVKSREQQFYYGHPQNRFWKLLAILFGCSEGALKNPQTIEEKKAFLMDNHIALWDVIESCEITGSSDSSIRNAKVNDLSLVIPHTKIDRILVNGGLAYRLFEKHMAGQAAQLGIPKERCFKMPSTSPANAAYSLDRLTECWRAGLK